MEKEIIKNASLLHDIGKIGIKDSVLQKEGKLTPEEYEHIKEQLMNSLVIHVDESPIKINGEQYYLHNISSF